MRDSGSGVGLGVWGAGVSWGLSVMVNRKHDVVPQDCFREAWPGVLLTEREI